MKYVDAINKAFDYLLRKNQNLVILGQGLWSPFYVGKSMDGLDEKYGRNRVIDTPVSENASTGVALGLAIAGSKSVVIHPRMDFMILAADQIVNEVAKWRYVLGENCNIPITIRGIINRGGEQGAQHSQALHSWFSHIPGLRVVMPALPQDAYKMLIQSVESPDPVIYIDDRWSYDYDASVETEVENELIPLSYEGPKVIKKGKDISLVGIGHSTLLCLEAAKKLCDYNIDCEVIDLRVLNPLNPSNIMESIKKTKRLIVVDGAWKNSGIAGEILATISENIKIDWLSNPIRITLPDSPAPSSKILENVYYFNSDTIIDKVKSILSIKINKK